MVPTALVFSSHQRSHHLHHDLIVQRALASADNKRVLILPMSMGPRSGDERPLQETEAENWAWYLRQYAAQGLEPVSFFWTEAMRPQDAEILWGFLESSAVVILAGGGSGLGLWRYKELGRRFAGEGDRFRKLLTERQARGQLTVGFSAGADQLMDRLFKSTQGSTDDTEGFGLVRATLATLHHDPSRDGELQHAARVTPASHVFGLPNDSGLLVSRGVTAQGNPWQLTRFVVDTSWDKPEDAWHVRTRQGAKIDHFYADGRHWAFNEGDWILRVWRTDGGGEAWIGSNGRVLAYGTQQPIAASGPEELIARE